MASLIVAIVGLVLGVGQVGFAEWLNSMGADMRKQIRSLVKDIQKKIASNNNLRDKLTVAYQNKNSEYLSRMMTGMGFGARMDSLRNAAKSAEEEYNKQMKTINDQNTALEAEADRLTSIGNDAGTVTGYNTAVEELRKEHSLPDTVIGSDLSQNVKGGMTNA